MNQINQSWMNICAPSNDVNLMQGQIKNQVAPQELSDNLGDKRRNSNYLFFPMGFQLDARFDLHELSQGADAYHRHSHHTMDTGSNWRGHTMDELVKIIDYHISWKQHTTSAHDYIETAMKNIGWMNCRWGKEEYAKEVPKNRSTCS